MSIVVADIAGPAIARIHRDACIIFAAENLPQGITVPRVTVDVPATEPEPFHVITHGTAREFGINGFLTGSAVSVTFKVRMSLIASGSTSDMAAQLANDYLARAVQITLCDTTLGGTVQEVGWPQVAESESWADQSGKRHAGYLLEFECSKMVTVNSEILTILEEVEDDS